MVAGIELGSIRDFDVAAEGKALSRPPIDSTPPPPKPVPSERRFS